MKKLFMLIAIISLAFFSCKKENSKPLRNTGVNSSDTVQKTYKVKYTIGCTDCEVVFYKDSLQNQQTEYHQNSSWSYTFYGKKNQSVLLLAYNTSTASQGVTATISVNDSVLTTQTNYCPVSGDAFVEDTIR